MGNIKIAYYTPILCKNVTQVSFIQELTPHHNYTKTRLLEHKQSESKCLSNIPSFTASIKLPEPITYL